VRENPAVAKADLSGAWLAVTLGVEPRELDIRRRAGELLGLPAASGTDFVYPSWQFDSAGRPRPIVSRTLRAAREAGLSDVELNDLLQRRDGMTGRGRLLDSLLAGREDRVLQQIRAAATAGRR
jgi:hypothetical protein